ncbi:MAG: hypothetical protein JRI84_12640 [Deltaproteobacteria bacterium]|nr:hypothetical protein [Deltaproteobacteria bacterium]
MDREYQIRRIVETVDQATVLESLIDLIKSGEKGRPISELLGKLSEHDVALTAISSQVSIQLVDRLTDFYNRQRREYQDILRIGKLFGFKKWEKIASDASAMAWKDTEMFVQKIDQIREITEKMVSAVRKDMMRFYVKQINHLLNSGGKALPEPGHEE